MPNHTVRRLEPVEWQAELTGSFPGQESWIELRPSKVRLILCWCPPPCADERSARDTARNLPEGSRHGFWIAKHPVNQQQWQAVMGSNPSPKSKGDHFPVDSVSWQDAQEFCGQTGLRLPTEAEWEYACRAGTATDFAVGTGEYLNSQLANFRGNNPDGKAPGAFDWLFRERTLAEGSFPPNAWGLHDMHGQLWEWCEDEIGSGARVLRGGSWFNFGWDARSGNRFGYAPGNRFDFCGFRPCPSSTRTSQPAGRRPGTRTSRGAGQGVQ
ncbi:MAG: formylglycine-generating enzyme family protein [Verrucomicrobiales bacterium]|nr:formylglycine-generating enzyme family protein [Verrucomicrobiales bacterium]